MWSIAKARAPAADYGLALAAASLVGVPGHRRAGPLDARCLRRHRDQLACAGGRSAGSGLALAARVRERSTPRALACDAPSPARLRSALFVWIEPRCLRGPYAMMDPAVWPIWLAHVREMQPLIALMVESPLTGIAIATFPVAALVAALVLARSRDLRRDFGFLVATAAFLAAVADDARGGQERVLRDLARHAAGRGLRAASVRGAAAAVARPARRGRRAADAGGAVARRDHHRERGRASGERRQLPPRAKATPASRPKATRRSRSFPAG